MKPLSSQLPQLLASFGSQSNRQRGVSAKCDLLIAVLVASLLTAQSATAAPFDNSSFEGPGLAPWASSGSVLTVSGLLLNNGGQMPPTDGTRFALLQTDGLDLPSTLTSPRFTAPANSEIAFDVFLSTDDDLLASGQSTDVASAQLLDLSRDTTIVLFSLDVATLLAGGNDTSPWSAQRYLIPEAGDYRLQFAVVDRGNEGGHTFLGVDNIRVAAVPLPSALGLFLSAIATLLRNRRQT